VSPTLKANGESAFISLRQVPLFSGLEESELWELARHARLRRFAAGQIILHQGEQGCGLFFLCSGLAYVQRRVSSGERIHIAQAGPGEYFGEIEILDGEPRLAEARAVSDCIVLFLDGKTFSRCLSRFPEIEARVMRCLASRLRRMVEDIELSRVSGIMPRVAQALLDLVAAQESSDVPIRLRVRQQQLAARLSTTRENVSRALTALKAEGVLGAEGHTLLIPRHRRLRRLT